MTGFPARGNRLPRIVFIGLLLGCGGCGSAPEKSDDPGTVEQQRQEYKANAQREMEDIRGAKQ